MCLKPCLPLVKNFFLDPQFLSHLQHQGWFPTGAKSCGTQSRGTILQLRKKHAIYIKSKKKTLYIVGSPTSYEINPLPEAAAW